MSDRPLFEKVYNPDVLSCLANLSSDEIFTPPELVNKMLDLLPDDIFRNPDIKFLDPCCKSGVFLREIAKRLIVGLEGQMPDLQERIDHIFHNQLYGIAITELTSLLSRRTLYCSKYPNTEFSITHFNNVQGHIYFRKIKHTWKNGRCIYCGALQAQYDRDESLETHAYEFIHLNNIEEISNMKFDVIISNPPYQLGAKNNSTQKDELHKTSDQPIYHMFVEQAKKLNPNYLCMIIPSRWMFGGKGLNEFRQSMINDKHITVLHDYFDSSDCFNGVEIKGGVCYFLREKDKTEPCQIFSHKKDSITVSTRYLKEEDTDIFVRQQELLEIKNKVWQNKSQNTFASIVSGQTPFGLYSNLFSTNSQQKGQLTNLLSNTPIEKGYKILGLIGTKRIWRFVPYDYPFPVRDGLNKYKVFIPSAYGAGILGEIPSSPVLSVPGEACTQTFIRIGAFDTKIESINVLKYIKTKFFRCLVGIIKQSQHANNRVYQFVPLQDFTDNSDIDWKKPVDKIDEQLYKKYALTQEEIDFIETMIESME